MSRMLKERLATYSIASRKGFLFGFFSKTNLETGKADNVDKNDYQRQVYFNLSLEENCFLSGLASVKKHL